MAETDLINSIDAILQQEDAIVVIGDNDKTAIEELWQEYNTYPHITNPKTGQSSNALSTVFKVKHYRSYDLQAMNVVTEED